MLFVRLQEQLFNSIKRPLSGLRAFPLRCHMEFITLFNPTHTHNGPPAHLLVFNRVRQIHGVCLTVRETWFPVNSVITLSLTLSSLMASLKSMSSSHVYLKAPTSDISKVTGEDIFISRAKRNIIQDQDRDEL